MIIPISSITNVQNSKRYSSKNRKSNSPSFEAVKFLEVANEYIEKAKLFESVFKQVYRDVDLWGPGYNTFPGYENMNEFR